MLENYYKSAKERADMGIPPLPLDAEQTSQLVELIKKSDGKNEELLTLLTERVPAGVDDEAYVKAAFLSDVAKKNIVTKVLNSKEATFIWVLCWVAIMLSL